MIEENNNGSGYFEKDLALTRNVIAGSVEAWHEFLEDYAELIYNVVRRHLPAADTDELRGVYVDVLKALYEGMLRNYRGTNDLRSWLLLVTRRRTVDYLRARYGRRREPKGVGNLGAADRDVFQLYYVDRLPLQVVLHLLEWKGYRLSVDELIESILRIEETVGQSLLRKLDERHAARSRGLGMERAMKYLVYSKVELEWRAKTERPDERYLEKETADRVERINKLLAQLPDEDREVARLRFHLGLSTKEIAHKLGIVKQRRVYTLVERIRRRLRAALRDSY